jgi:acetylornithine deacetylase/succinyl-diaminopimelate desuccinylase-like protein
MADDDTAITEHATELLRTLIRNACVNDGALPGHEERNADALEDYFAGSSLSCQRYTAAPGRTSLVTRIEGRDSAAPTLLLMGHTDVVPAPSDGWCRDPFGAELVDGIVWGRGAVDMLNLTATMAVAVRRLAVGAFRPRGTVVFLAVADEEAAGVYGLGSLLARAPDLVRADYVITESGGVPVPTPDGIVLPLTVGEKGVNGRRVTIRGTAGHGALPFGTDNALVTAAAVVQRIAAYQPRARILDVWRRAVAELGLGPELTEMLTDPDLVLGAVAALPSPGLARLVHACTHTTFSPNVLRGGTSVNVIPERISIDVDIRALPGVSPAEVDAMLAEALGDLADRVDVEPLSADEGSLSSPDTPLADALRRVTAALVPGSRIVPHLAPGASDARYFRWRGVPAYGFGLHSPRIPASEYPLMFHGPNERIDVESLRLSTLMWESLCRDFLA